MSSSGEDNLLRQAVALCARGALASKAAYMQTLEQGDERTLLKRCTDRYALLERLLGLLVERTAPQEIRELMDGMDADPDRYAHLEAALADLQRADASLVRLLMDALAERRLPTAIVSCFEDALATLRGSTRQPTIAIAPAAMLRSRTAAKPCG